MTLIGYNQNIPNPPNNPSNDVGIMQTNALALANIIKVDHVGFNVNNSGYHTVIHQQPFNGNTWNPTARTGGPAPIVGVQQIFALNDVPNYAGAPTNTQLFSMNDGGGVSQLTGAAFDNADFSDGWCWAGSILLQWGIVNGPFSSGVTTNSVTFQNRPLGASGNHGIPFPNACFMVQATPLISYSNPPSSQGTVGVRESTLANTGFEWLFFTNSNQYLGFTWFAIGW